MAASEPINPSMLLGQALFDAIRQAVREEIKAAANRNGHEPKLLYNTKEAAELCGVPETWLASAARSGKVKCRHLGSYVRFALEDLKELIDKAANEGS